MELTQKEKTLIVQALYAVAPTGGGSTQFHLAMKLANEWSVDVTDDEFHPHVGSYQAIAYEEYKEAMGL